MIVKTFILRKEIRALRTKSIRYKKSFRDHGRSSKLGCPDSVIAMINLHNRINAITRQPAGHYRPGRWS
jgi:hypothetical protein